MLILALDTTTRVGSVALLQDGQVVDAVSGDAAVPHGVRLPGEIRDLLARHRYAVSDVELFGVAAGPGSFTGLRVGIATVQGLAFATRRPVVGVSALEAIAWTIWRDATPPPGVWRIGACMDAHRAEAFGALYEIDPAHGPAEIAPPLVGRPLEIARAWAPHREGATLWLAGDAAGAVAAGFGGGATVGVTAAVPPLAPTIGLIAARERARGASGGPEAIRPLYIRRSDAEFARDRRTRSGA